MQPLREMGVIDPATFAELSAASQPFVMRGLAADWPLVVAGRETQRAALNALAAFDSGQPIEVMLAPPEVGGRFFYGPNVEGFNFLRRSTSLRTLIDNLLVQADGPQGNAIYAGAGETRVHLPGFDTQNPLPLLSSARDAQSRIWLCNRAEVATHFDLSDNVAVVALGRRRFTLFPPQAAGDLYIGPFDRTLAGQPISMVDPLRPDLERYPRFSAAQALAQSAELGPGDAVFIPTMWWHHVAALDSINLMVNYWYNNAERGGPFLAFIHALWAIRDLPQAQREGWRAWFDHFVFAPNAPHASDHLPETARGVNGAASPQRSEMIRQFLLRVLS